MESANPVSTTGEDEMSWEREDSMGKSEEREVNRFRALAGRANYMSLDPPDTQFPVRKICKGIAAPTGPYEEDEEGLPGTWSESRKQ